MKRFLLLMMTLVLCLGCQSRDITDESAIVSATGDYYRMISKGQSANRENFYLDYASTRDLVAIGSGLMTLSQAHFSTNTYYLAEGSQLTSDDYNALKKRDAADAKTQKYPYSLQVPHGTMVDGIKDPVLVDNISELDFYKKGNEYELAGAAFAVILEPRDENNELLKTSLSKKTIASFAKETIARMYTFIREQKQNLADLPILITVYMANDGETSFNNGHYLYQAYCTKGKVGTCEKVDHQTVVFTSDAATAIDATTASEFTKLRNALKASATEAAGLMGEATYIDQKITSMKITAKLNIKTYTELLYLTSVLQKDLSSAFSQDFPVKLLVYSQDELMAFIIKTPGKGVETTIIEA